MQDAAKQALELKDHAFAVELQEVSSPKSVLDQSASSSSSLEYGTKHCGSPPLQVCD